MQLRNSSSSLSRHPMFIGSLLTASLLSISGRALAVDVATAGDFHTATAGNVAFINITAGFTLTANETVATGTRLEFQPGAVITKGSGATSLRIEGLVPDRPDQFFAGWAPGEVRGNFRGQPRLPEWWGAKINSSGVDSAPAINCAVKSRQEDHMGVETVLGSGNYYIAEPIDLGGCSANLKGSGANRTFIHAKEGWNASLVHRDAYYGDNHQAMIWMGGTLHVSNQSMFSHVTGLTINAHAASGASSSTWVSGISSYGFVEENCVIDDVAIDGYNGYGIGFGDINTADDNSLNGLRIGGINIGPPLRSPAYSSADITHQIPRPVFIGAHSGVVQLNGGTINLGTHNAMYMYRMAAVTVFGGGLHTHISNLHVEACGVAVLVLQSSGSPGNVKIDNVDLTWGTESGMQFWDSTWTNGPSNPPTASLTDWSSVVLIRGQIGAYQEGTDHLDRVTVTNISSNRASFLLRDPVYNVHLVATSSGPVAYGSMSFYARGIPIAVPSPGHSSYTPTWLYWAPSTDFDANVKRLTIGPLF